MDVNFLSSHHFVHRDLVSGKMLSWHQEDESLVGTREEAIAVIQRTIDFWLPKLRDELRASNGLSLDAASAIAVGTFSNNLQEMLDRPFPRKFGLRFTDFTLSLP